MADGKPLAEADGPARVFAIRDALVTAVRDKRQLPEAARFFGELKDLKRKPLSDTWLEAFVLSAVTLRIAPSRTVRFLNMLRERADKTGKRAEFDAFDAMIRDFLHPLQLTNHSYREATFATMNHDDVWARVGAHLAELTADAARVFLNSGTLLGVIRDRKLIDHDDDIDLAILMQADSLDAAVDEWLGLKDRLKALGLFDAETTDQPSIYKLKPAGAVEIDLFPAWTENGRVFVYPHTFGDLAVEDVLPLKTCEITRHHIPAEPEKMLAVNYGAGWRDPDPLFKFPWVEARKRFATFLEGIGQ